MNRIPEFSLLVTNYRQKIQLNAIKFTTMSNNANKYLSSPLQYMANDFFMTFDYGLFYKKGKI